jgi:hypothetical protein
MAESKKTVPDELEKNGRKRNLFGRLIQTWALARLGVARWFIFKPKIPIWVNFSGP